MNIIFSLFLFSLVFAQTLRIDAIEFSLGKFHRQANMLHPYSQQHAFKSFILPTNADDLKTFSVEQSKTHYSIFFTNLIDLFMMMDQISQTTGNKIQILNMTAHGTPGGLLIPRDPERMKSVECFQWKRSVTEPDGKVYEDYYKFSTIENLKAYEELSKEDHAPLFRCISGHKDWAIAMEQVPRLKTQFSHDAQIHFISCLVGKGELGFKFTESILKTSISIPDSQRVQASQELGLGDWSMDQGMGFWTFLDQEQYSFDFKNYPLFKEDALFKQHGNITTSEFIHGKIKTGVIKDADFLSVEKDLRPISD